jgi:co-chaperonin GroES (HSP10)
MRSPFKFIVDIEKPYMDEAPTESGIKLYRDTTFHPENYAQTHGVVTSLPLKNDLDVQKGDQIYFSYQVVEDKIQRDRDTDVHKNLIFYKGQKSWLVDTTLIYFRVRNDQIGMLNKYALVDLMEEEQTSSLIVPDYLKKVKLLGQARVIASANIRAGEVILFDKRFIETYEIFGREYYILHEERILAKL